MTKTKLTMVSINRKAFFVNLPVDGYGKVHLSGYALDRLLVVCGVSRGQCFMIG